MLDRNARDSLAFAIESYLKSEIDNIAFDKKIYTIESDDALIDFSRYWVWYFYDDIKRHEVSVDRDGWNFLYRLILLLRSDRSVMIYEERVPLKDCLSKFEEDGINHCFPFRDFRQLRQVRQEVKGFIKQPYPKGLCEREVYDEIEMKSIWWIAWLFLPLILLLQLFRCLQGSKTMIEILDVCDAVS